MNIDQLKTLAENHIRYLLSQRDNAVTIGDAEAIARIDGEIAETQTTLNNLNGL